jgi:hypothetical protein
VEHEAATQVHTRAKHRIGELINTIVIGRAIAEAVDLQTKWAEVWNVFDRLYALSSLWMPGPGGSRLVTLPAPVVRLIQQVGSVDSRALDWPAGRNPRAESKSNRWREWRSNPENQPDAQF